METQTETLNRLVAVAAEYQEAKEHFERLGLEATQAVIDARRAGNTPTAVSKASPFTIAWTWRIAKDAGIPPGTPGRKKRAAINP